MEGSDRLNVVLFALTGFGNTVFKALLADVRVNLAAVFTVKYNNPFPYYEEQHLYDVCQQAQVACYHGIKVGSEEGMTLLQKHAPDFIVVATFKQILPSNVLNLPRLGVVNLHPSLLPQYRGPCPTNAALLNGEKITGITAHYIVEAIDEGNILFQRKIFLEGINNDGELRHKLANLAGEMIPELINMFSSFEKPAGKPQDHSQATQASKPVVEDGYLETAVTITEIQRRIRAYNPLPGTSIQIGKQRIPVDRYEVPQDGAQEEFVENETFVDWTLNSQTIRLFKTVNG